MTTYSIGNRNSGADLGLFEADSVCLALDAMAQDAGYKDHADCLEQLHGMSWADFQDQWVKPGVDLTAEAFRQIAEDHALGADGTYEIPHQYRSDPHGWVPTCSIKNDMVVEAVE